MRVIPLVFAFVCLSFITRWTTQALYHIFYVISRSQKFSLSFITLLLFPGTIIHELSHVFVAEILGVHTGRLSLIAEAIEGSDEEIRAGSVAIAKTDPIRRTIIGLAPVLVGLTALTLLSYMLTQPTLFIPNLDTRISHLVIFYLLFTISNSMFSSREDVKGIPAVLVTLALFALGGYIAGLRIHLTGQAEQIGTTIVISLTKSLGLVLAVNGVILLVLKLIMRFVRR